MRNLYALFLLFLTSCSSSNDETKEFSLIGTWTGVADSSGYLPDESPVVFYENGRTVWTYEGQGNDGQDILEEGSWTHVNESVTIEWDEADSGLETLIIDVTELTEMSLKWSYGSGDDLVSSCYKRLD